MGAIVCACVVIVTRPLLCLVSITCLCVQGRSHWSAACGCHAGVQVSRGEVAQVLVLLHLRGVLVPACMRNLGYCALAQVLL
jgi:hypothetical protein